MHIALIGASGVVGKELLQLMERDLSFPIEKLSLFASSRSKGKTILFRNNPIVLQELEERSFDDIELAFFAGGGSVSKQWIPIAREKGVTSIDLSSAFRQEKDIPLIIPEINGHLLNEEAKIIASPNCTTTVLLMPIYNLHKKFQVRRIITSTYQAASGGGEKLLTKLLEDTKEALTGKPSSLNSYGYNVFLHESPLCDNSYSEEESKMAHETRKILEDEKILLSATCVRVPVIRSHSVSANVEFASPFSLDEVKETVKQTKGTILCEDFNPTPSFSSNKEHVYCSRFRVDQTKKNCLEFWACGDQLLKGAALNAFQIACHLVDKQKASIN